MSRGGFLEGAPAAPAAASEPAARYGPYEWERPSDSSGGLLVVSGPSGVGKGTILRAVMAAHPAAFALSVSHTSRQPRVGEVEGLHYYFSTRQQLDQMLADGKFFESAVFADNRYGTSIQEIERIQRSGRICVVEIELEGVRQVLARPPGQLTTKCLFIRPPSIGDLERRLKGRGTESAEKIRARLAIATSELEAAAAMPFDAVVVNQQLQEAVDAVAQLALAWFPSSAHVHSQEAAQPPP
eukprot:GHVT01087436.1.p1 GENE.GHVT01087436.1~~GHVT01087436.1.p1  ORF type:complete len:241 (+),score=66.65 GHVT01087436.1:336-1058(+)